MTEKKRSTTSESPKGKAPSKKAVPPQTSTTPKTRARKTAASISTTLKRAAVDVLMAEAVSLGVSLKTIQNIIETNGGRKRIDDVPESRVDDVKVALKAYIAQIKVNKLTGRKKPASGTQAQGDDAKWKERCAELLQQVDTKMGQDLRVVVLKKFGVRKLSDIAPAQYQVFAEHCERELSLFADIQASTAKLAEEMTLTNLNPDSVVNHLRETVEALESGKFKHYSGGIVLNQENGRDDPAMRGAVTIKSDLVLVPNHDYRTDPKAASFQEQVTFQDHVRSVTGDMTQQMAEAESRKLAMQTEAAINLGIGFVLKALGQDAIAIHPDALKKFTSEYKVEQEILAGGSFTVKVVPRN